MIATGDRFADSLIEGIENISGLDNATRAVINSYDNASIEAVMDTVAGLDLRTPAGKGAVSADKRQLLAYVTRWSRMEARHLAGILLALDEGDDIVA